MRNNPLNGFDPYQPRQSMQNDSSNQGTTEPQENRGLRNYRQRNEESEPLEQQSFEDRPNYRNRQQRSETNINQQETFSNRQRRDTSNRSRRSALNDEQDQERSHINARTNRDQQNRRPQTQQRIIETDDGLQNNQKVCILWSLFDTQHYQREQQTQTGQCKMGSHPAYCPENLKKENCPNIQQCAFFHIKKGICKRQSDCQKGDQCYFLHAKQCKFFVKKDCRYQTSVACKYGHHLEIQEQTAASQTNNSFPQDQRPNYLPRQRNHQENRQNKRRQILNFTQQISQRFHERQQPVLGSAEVRSIQSNQPAQQQLQQDDDSDSQSQSSKQSVISKEQALDQIPMKATARFNMSNYQFLQEAASLYRDLCDFNDQQNSLKVTFEFCLESRIQDILQQQIAQIQKHTAALNLSLKQISADRLQLQLQQENLSRTANLHYQLRIFLLKVASFNIKGINVVYQNLNRQQLECIKQGQQFLHDINLAIEVDLERYLGDEEDLDEAAGENALKDVQQSNSPAVAQKTIEINYSSQDQLKFVINDLQNYQKIVKTIREDQVLKKYVKIFRNRSQLGYLIQPLQQGQETIVQKIADECLKLRDRTIVRNLYQDEHSKMKAALLQYNSKAFLSNLNHLKNSQNYFSSMTVFTGQEIKQYKERVARVWMPLRDCDINLHDESIYVAIQVDAPDFNGDQDSVMFQKELVNFFKLVKQLEFSHSVQTKIYSELEDTELSQLQAQFPLWSIQKFQQPQFFNQQWTQFFNLNFFYLTEISAINKIYKEANQTAEIINQKINALYQKEITLELKDWQAKALKNGFAEHLEKICQKHRLILKVEQKKKNDRQRQQHQDEQQVDRGDDIIDSGKTTFLKISGPRQQVQDCQLELVSQLQLLKHVDVSVSQMNSEDGVMLWKTTTEIFDSPQDKEKWMQELTATREKCQQILKQKCKYRHPLCHQGENCQKVEKNQCPFDHQNKEKLVFEVFYENQTESGYFKSKENLKKIIQDFWLDLKIAKFPATDKSVSEFLENNSENNLLFIQKTREQQIILAKTSKIAEITDEINQIKQSQIRNKLVTIKFDNFLIFIKTQKEYQRNQPNFQYYFNFKVRKLQIRGPEDKLENEKKQIEQYIASWKLFEDELALTRTQFRIIKLNMKQIKEIEKKLTCSISISQTQKIEIDQKNLAQLSDGRITLALVNDKITNIQAEIIVNSVIKTLQFENISQLQGVALDIVQQAGYNYKRECKQIMRGRRELNNGEIPGNMKNCQNILNVAVPLYQDGESVQANMQVIHECIGNVLTKADEMGYQSLALPLLGAGMGGYYLSDIIEEILHSLLQELFFSQKRVFSHLKRVFIVETDNEKCQYLLHAMKECTEQQSLLLQSRLTLNNIPGYQWQWQTDNNVFQNYDDAFINKQINIMYGENGRQDKWLSLPKFPFWKTPGTHNVNLQNMTVTKMNAPRTQHMILKQESTGQLLIKPSLYKNKSEDLLQQEISEYLDLQNARGIQQFELFLCEYEINFASMKQRNKQTQFERSIRMNSQQEDDNQMRHRYKKYQEKRQLFAQCQRLQKEFYQSTFNKQQQKDNRQVEQNSSKEVNIIKIQALARKDIESAKQEIQQVCNEKMKKKQINIPQNIDDQILENINKEILKLEIKIEGARFIQGETITLEGVPEDVEQIEKYIDLIAQVSKKVGQKTIAFPQSWTLTGDDFQLIQLNVLSEEYKKIQDRFNQTMPGRTIVTINRIQNKPQWKNYQTEISKMIEDKKRINIHIQEDGKELFVWHGTKNQHPEIIYKSLAEGFDSTYASDSNMWGPGIYFAYNANYADSYAHTIQDRNFMLNFNMIAGRSNQKKVLLYCRIAIGCEVILPPDRSLKRPPFIDQGDQQKGYYDTVKGNTNGSDVYIIYQMNARRAYPEYEVTYM